MGEKLKFTLFKARVMDISTVLAALLFICSNMLLPLPQALLVFYNN